MMLIVGESYSQRAVGIASLCQHISYVRLMVHHGIRPAEHRIEQKSTSERRDVLERQIRGVLMKRLPFNLSLRKIKCTKIIKSKRSPGKLQRGLLK